MKIMTYDMPNVPRATMISLYLHSGCTSPLLFFDLCYCCCNLFCFFFFYFHFLLVTVPSSHVIQPETMHQKCALAGKSPFDSSLFCSAIGMVWPPFRMHINDQHITINTHPGEHTQCRRSLILIIYANVISLIAFRILSFRSSSRSV